MSRHTPPGFAVPAGACDCHMHVFGPHDRYPLTPVRSYTPRPASLADYKAMTSILGLERVVFVQASCYGADNRRMLDAIAEFGPNARGIAGIDDDTTAAELKAMDAGGMRGVRVNAASRSLEDPAIFKAEMEATVRRIAPLGWHAQIFAHLPLIDTLADFLLSLPVPVVIDHMGLAPAALGTGQPGFETLLRLLDSGKVWVKLSGPYRISKQEPEFADADPIARALAHRNPERVVWATDWPHTPPHAGKPGEDPPLLDYRPLDDGHLLRILRRAVGDDAILTRILIDNPAKLYGF